MSKKCKNESIGTFKQIPIKEKLETKSEEKMRKSLKEKDKEEKRPKGSKYYRDYDEEEEYYDEYYEEEGDGYYDYGAGLFAKNVISRKLKMLRKLKIITKANNPLPP